MVLTNPAVEWVPWRTAMQRALYGNDGFYLRERPSAHFRTSVHASDRFAGALAVLLVEVDRRLGHPDRFDLVDIGAGCGGLLARLVEEVQARDHTHDRDGEGLRGRDGEGARGRDGTGLAARLAPVAIEVAERPAGLPAVIDWRHELPGPDEITGMVIANEWLDNVPLDIVEQTPGGPRMVLVDPLTGSERHGAAPGDADGDWLHRWWPLREAGERAEIGRHRCAAWGSVVAALRQGLAIAIDYGHTRATRPPYGTLAGYRDGHAVPPVPDGACDITAHVALDACAAAGEHAGAAQSLLTTQRLALSALGVTGARPPIELAGRDPRGYVRALCAAGEEAELIDPGGLGGFGWLVQSAGIGIPAPLAELDLRGPSTPAESPPRSPTAMSGGL